MAKNKKTLSKKTTAPTAWHHHVKRALVPHRHNQYRPYLVRRGGLVAMVAFVVLAQVFYNGVTTGSVLGAHTNISVQSLLGATNTARTTEGEQPLELDGRLMEAARLKAEDMFTNQYWAHESPSGTTPWYWFSDVKYNYSQAGENLAKNFSSADTVVSAWLKSPEHRANVLKAAYQNVGFAVKQGVLNGESTTLVVALYGAPAEAGVQGVAAVTDAPATNQPLSIVARLGLGVQSLTPAALGSIVSLILGAVVAAAAHMYRKKLPASLRRSWYRHHGAYKAAGLVSLVVVLITLYGGGQL